MVALLFCTLALAIGCGHERELAAPGGSLPGAASATSPEIRAMAQQLLGSGAEVLASGDLASDGQRQVLVVNRAVANRLDTKRGIGPGVVFSRAAILEQRGAKWSELLLCDEYLKNTKGFLGGAPKVPTSAWRLQIIPNAAGGTIREFDFTPLKADENERPGIIVRWNLRSNGYQSFDPATGQFLNEVTLLEPPSSELR